MHRAITALKRLALGLGWVGVAIYGAVVVIPGAILVVGFYYYVGKLVGLWG